MHVKTFLPPLSHDEEMECIKRLGEKDTNARDELILHNLNSLHYEFLSQFDSLSYPFLHNEFDFLLHLSYYSHIQHLFSISLSFSLV